MADLIDDEPKENKNEDVKFKRFYILALIVWLVCICSFLIIHLSGYKTNFLYFIKNLFLVFGIISIPVIILFSFPIRWLERKMDNYVEKKKIK